MILLANLLFLILNGLTSVAKAFPDTNRHGYTNCSTCHMSPAGGGLLTNYGRSLSNELMSTWGYKNEESLLHGLIKTSDEAKPKFTMGGDFRYLSHQVKTSQTTRDDSFWMQTQLRAQVQIQQLGLFLTAGKLENPTASQEVRLVGTEYYALWSPQEQVYFRIGRFEPIFGLRLPDHNLWIRSETAFVPWNERDGVESIFESEKQFVSVAGFQSTSANPPAFQKTGYIGNVLQTFEEKTRIGLSGLNGEGQGSRRRIMSLHGSVPFSDNFFTLFEVLRIWSSEGDKDIGFQRLGYEAFKGFVPFVQGQFKQDLNNHDNDATRLGAGINWLPRPHFELVFAYETQHESKGDTTEGLLLFHYYL